MNSFSIIIPVYNGAATIEKCLQALMQLDYPKENYEVIVVNDGSTDGTAEIARKFPVRLIDLGKNVGQIIAREIGAKNAKFDLIILMDSDCLPKKNWLKEFDRANYQPAAGRTISDSGSGEIGRFLYLFREKYYLKVLKPVMISKENFDRIAKGTENFLIDKNFFLQCSPEKKEWTVSADMTLFSKIMEKRQIMKNPDAIVLHMERRSRIALWKQWLLRGITFADYHLQGAKKFNLLFNSGILSLALVLAASVFYPAIFLAALVLAAIALLLVPLHFIEKPSDYKIFLPNFVILLAAFVCGIAKARKMHLASIFLIVLFAIFWRVAA